jgi:hypothetical protein
LPAGKSSATELTEESSKSSRSRHDCKR